MKEYIVELQPRSSMEGRLSSDTLFGAFCWAVRTLYGESKLHPMLEAFQENPPFLMSSAFPFQRVGTVETFFLPRPLYPPMKADAIAALATAEKRFMSTKLYHSSKAGQVKIIEKYKAFQHIRWISEAFYHAVSELGIEGETVLFRQYLRGHIHRVPLREEGVQKNALDRLSASTGGSGNTFYNNELTMPRTFGLYFLLKTADIAFIEPLLRYLEDSGIGTNARTGKNFFQIHCREKKISSPSRGRSFVTLSRTILNQEPDFSGSYYEVETVRSKVESRAEFAGEDVWKDAVTYLKEGSIITPIQTGNHFGGVFPVKKIRGKTVYQYGLAYPFWGDFGEEKN